MAGFIQNKIIRTNNPMNEEELNILARDWWTLVAILPVGEKYDYHFIRIAKKEIQKVKEMGNG